jgi:hypothetical protein
MIDGISLYALDVSDPATPTLIDAQWGLNIWGVETDGTFVYVSGNFGFLVFALDVACGDANGDGIADIGDAVFLINFVFTHGPSPTPVCIGDANGDGETNVGDAIYMINYVFRGGPPPVSGCCR